MTSAPTRQNRVALIGYGLGDRRFDALCVPWLRGEGPPPVAPADAIAVLDIIEAAQRSAAEGK